LPICNLILLEYLLSTIIIQFNLKIFEIKHLTILILSVCPVQLPGISYGGLKALWNNLYNKSRCKSGKAWLM
jgi:hypothetical protein